jgi:hypothetical protein
MPGMTGFPIFEEDSIEKIRRWQQQCVPDACRRSPIEVKCGFTGPLIAPGEADHAGPRLSRMNGMQEFLHDPVHGLRLLGHDHMTRSGNDFKTRCRHVLMEVSRVFGRGQLIPVPA